VAYLFLVGLIVRSVTEIPNIQTFEVAKERHTQWKSGQLVREWAAQFPQLFDELDLNHAVSVCGKGKLFGEWLAAILLHQTTGYCSLAIKYETPSHERKRRTLERLFDREVCHYLTRRPNRALAPDLLMYNADFSDCFFCEVKGPSDQSRLEQMQRFTEVTAKTGKSIKLIQFVWRMNR
jgi:hypothetical protein